MDEKNEALNEVVEAADPIEEEPTEAEASEETFSHQSKPRITQDPISDSDFDDEYQGPYEHDSDFIVQEGGLLGKLSDRRSKAQIGQLRRDLHYGQYLEVPKGRRDIFVSKERATRAKTFIALVVVLAALAAVGWFVVEYLQTRFG